MVPHVGLSAVQEPLELQTIRVPIGDDVADLADDGREYEDADQVADYREDVPVNQEGRKRADQSEGGVISVLRSWTSGPRRSLPPLSLFIFSLLSYLPSLRSFLSFSLSHTLSRKRTHIHTQSYTYTIPSFFTCITSLSFLALSFSLSLFSFPHLYSFYRDISFSASLSRIHSNTYTATYTQQRAHSHTYICTPACR